MYFHVLRLFVQIVWCLLPPVDPQRRVVPNLSCLIIITARKCIQTSCKHANLFFSAFDQSTNQWQQYILFAWRQSAVIHSNPICFQSEILPTPRRRDFFTSFWEIPSDTGFYILLWWFCFNHNSMYEIGQELFIENIMKRTSN